MENTLENKAKFFAQYWMQDVLFIRDEHDLALWNVQIYTDQIDDWHLLLTPLSSITDEDATALGRIFGYRIDRPDSAGLGKIMALGIRDQSLCSSGLIKGYQYLQSKGYALPYMGLSVEELVNRGWVKLKEANNG